MAYVQDDGDDESLWIRQTATPSNVQIVAPRPDVRIGALTVTPDGNFVDYVAISSPRRSLIRCGACRFSAVRRGDSSIACTAALAGRRTAGNSRSSACMERSARRGWTL